MDTRDILKNLREQNHLTQDEMAEKLFVTRQAVSRWENGETVPGTESLKLISRTFDVSINMLLGCPQKRICQCCGMPLDEDAWMSREPDMSFNEDYCKWCYADGAFTYEDASELIRYLVSQFSSEDFPPEQASVYFSESICQLKHWRDRHSKTE